MNFIQMFSLRTQGLCGKKFQVLICPPADTLCSSDSGEGDREANVTGGVLCIASNSDPQRPDKLNFCSKYDGNLTAWINNYIEIICIKQKAKKKAHF